MGNGAGLSGLAYYSFGVFVIPLTEAFGWNVGQVTGGSSFLILGTAFTAPVVGFLIDRFGAYRVSLVSFAALVAGFVLLTRLSGAIAAFWAAWLLISLVGGGTTPVLWTRTVGLWFDRGRGLALGLALAGSGLASMFAPSLLTKAILAWGWQAGYLAVAAFIGVVAMPLIALLFVERPQRTALTSLEDWKIAELHGPEPREALRQAAFWKIAVGFFLVSGVIGGLIINLVKLLVESGMDRVQAAGVAGVMGLAVIVGRVGIGFLLDRLAARFVACVILLLCAAGCQALAQPGLPLWAVSACVISLGLGAAAEVDLVAYLTSRYLGMKHYGRIYGMQLSAFYLGAALGPAAIGYSFNHFGSYGPALGFAVASLVFGAVVIATLGRPPEFGDAASH
ncbi:MAG: MFS transporter [Steroidobacteraceae bacterium]